MPPLSVEILDEAIQDLVDRIRAGQVYGEKLAEMVACEHEIKPEPLRRHFERRYPSGYVGAALPSAKDRASSVARAEAARQLAEFGEFAKVDGREILLNGSLYTLITENRSRRYVIAFLHSDMTLTRIPYADFEGMQKARP